MSAASPPGELEPPPRRPFIRYKEPADKALQPTRSPFPITMVYLITHPRPPVMCRLQLPRR